MSPRWASAIARLGAALKSRRAAFITLASVGVIAAGLLFFNVRGDGEPKHRGHTASTWIQLGATNTILIPEVVEAFEQMGPEGIRFLGEVLLREPSRQDKWLQEHHQYIPGVLKAGLLSPPAAVRHDTVLLILASLGTNAAPAVPSLLTWLQGKAQTFSFDIPLNTPGFNIRTNHSFSPRATDPPMLTMSPSNTPSLLILPAYANTVMSTQLVVSANGKLGTNLNIQVTPHRKQIPDRAVRILTTVGGDDPRIAEVLTYPTPASPADPFPKLGLQVKPSVMRSIHTLIQCAENAEPVRRVRALALLELAMPESTETRDLLRRTLEDHDQEVFLMAARTLRRSPNSMDRLVALTASGLRTPYGWYERELDELRSLVRSSPGATDYLQSRLKMPATVRQTALLVMLIGETAPPGGVDLNLISSFTNRLEAVIRAQACETMGLLTTNTSLLAHAYIIRIETNPEDSITIAQAYRKLGEMGTNGHTVVPWLIKGLNSDEVRSVMAAAEALGEMGPYAEAALPVLQRLTAHDNARVRGSATDALRRLKSSKDK